MNERKKQVTFLDTARAGGLGCMVEEAANNVVEHVRGDINQVK